MERARALLVVALCYLCVTCVSGRHSWNLDMPKLPAVCNANLEGPYPLPPANWTLKQVLVVGRHGDRTQIRDTSCWPNNNSTYDCDAVQMYVFPLGLSDTSTKTEGANSPNVFFHRKINFEHAFIKGTCGRAELTPTGFLQWQKQGAYFRSVYVDYLRFLSTYYAQPEIYLRARVLTRTEESTQAFFIGLYPKAYRPDNLQIDIETFDADIDTISPAWGLLQSESHKTQAWSDHMKAVTFPLAVELEKVRGRVDTDMNYFRDCTMASVCHSQPLPAAYTQDLVDRVNADANWKYYFETSYPNTTYYSRLGIGFFMGDLWDAMAAVVSPGSGPRSAWGKRADPVLRAQREAAVQPKFRFYGGHDGTMSLMKSALQIENKVWPPFAVQFTFELYQSTATKGYGVRVLYNWEEKQIPGCKGIICTWAEWETIMRRIVITDPEMKECGPMLTPERKS